MKMSVRCSPPALIHVTTSWEAFPVPAHLVSPFQQTLTNAKVRKRTGTGFVIKTQIRNGNVLF